MTEWGLQAANHSGVAVDIGQSLDGTSKRKLAKYYVDRIAERVHSMALGNHIEVTLSGGVAELFYSNEQTDFGDLGLEICKALTETSIPLSAHIPIHQGRATVCGITLNSTKVSGSTIFVDKNVSLPIRSAPILFKLKQDDVEDSTLDRILEERACAIDLDDVPKEKLEQLAGTLRTKLKGRTVPLIILMKPNYARYLGNLISDWGTRNCPIIVIDEVKADSATFLSVGKPISNSLPIQFFGYQTVRPS